MKYILALIVFTSFSCSAQKTSVIQKTYHFMQERFPGNMPVDDNGNALKHGPDTLDLIYIETTREGLNWQTAWKNGIAYSISIVPIKESSFQLGMLKGDERNVVIIPKEGNQLWQLELHPAETKKQQPFIKNYQHNDIILEGIYEKRKFYYTIKNGTMLKSMPSY